MEEEEKTTYIDDITEASRQRGRPKKEGAGRIITTVSAPFLLKNRMEKYNISPSDAFQEGALMLLNCNDKFLESGDAYEKTLRRGVYVDKLHRLTKTLSEMASGGKHEEHRENQETDSFG